MLKTASPSLSSTSKMEAALLIAEGRLTAREISKKLGISDRALRHWKRSPKFAARVAALSAEFAEASKKRGIARREYRVNNLANLLSDCLQVIEERAADPKMANVPGGKTGLVVMQVKRLGNKLMPEFVVDTTLIREIRAIQEQAAKELGQLVEKQEMKINARAIGDLTDEELNALCEQLGITEDSHRC
jgi:hypothetical protein